MTIVAIAVVAALVIGMVVVIASRRTSHPPDDIDAFRRQIDALSPEARRQTSERMKPSDGRPTSDDGADGI
jgi:hypothetical protein